jgi:hypothetical protein
MKDAQQRDVNQYSVPTGRGAAGGAQHFYQYSVPTGRRKHLLNITSIIKKRHPAIGSCAAMAGCLFDAVIDYRNQITLQ